MAFGIPGYFGRDPDPMPEPLIPGSRNKTIRVKVSGLLVLLRDKNREMTRDFCPDH
jgi:hypothetical protein